MWLAESAWKACQTMDGSYYFKPLDPRVKKRYLEKLVCVHLSIKDNVTGESANSCLVALLDEGAHIFNISSSLMKRTFSGTGKSLPVHL